MECTHEVLTGGGIDAGLPSHCCIHHGQERRRRLDDGDTAHPGRCRETGKVCHGSTAKTHDGVAAAKSSLAQHVPEVCQDVELLGRFGVGNLGHSGLQPMFGCSGG